MDMKLILLICMYVIASVVGTRFLHIYINSIDRSWYDLFAGVMALILAISIVF